MKNQIFVLLFSVLTSVSCDILDPDEDGYFNWKSGGINSTDNDTKIPEDVKTLLKNDAEFLVFRDIISNRNLKENQIELPESEIEKYYNGLVRIYNARNYSPINKIYNRQSIHVFESPSLVSLVVGIDTSVEWTHAWLNGQRLTGNSSIDNLMETYNISLSNIYSNFISLLSEKSYNLYALSIMFKEIEGVNWAEPDGLIGGGNNVFAKKLNDGNLYYTFMVGWADCPSGCINAHYWDVFVSIDGRVKFIKEYGDPLEWQN